MAMLRLDTLLSVVWSRALGNPAQGIEPDLECLNRALKISDMMGKIMGTAAPKRHQIRSDPESPPVKMFDRRLDLTSLVPHLRIPLLAHLVKDESKLSPEAREAVERYRAEQEANEAAPKQVEVTPPSPRPRTATGSATTSVCGPDAPESATLKEGPGMSRDEDLGTYFDAEQFLLLVTKMAWGEWCYFVEGAEELPERRVRGSLLPVLTRGEFVSRRRRDLEVLATVRSTVRGGASRWSSSCPSPPTGTDGRGRPGGAARWRSCSCGPVGRPSPEPPRQHAPDPSGRVRTGGDGAPPRGPVRAGGGWPGICLDARGLAGR